MNKYQKANELIHLSEDQKRDMLANILHENTEPVRKGFVFRPWMAGLTAAFAVLILWFGVFERSAAPMPAPMANESAAGVSEEMEMETAEESVTTDEAPSEARTAGTLGSVNDSAEFFAAADADNRIIIGKEAEKMDFEAYGERRDVTILDTPVSIYGNRAVLFALHEESYAIVSDRELSDEELNELITNIIRDFGG